METVLCGEALGSGQAAWMPPSPHGRNQGGCGGCGVEPDTSQRSRSREDTAVKVEVKHRVPSGMKNRAPGEGPAREPVAEWAFGPQGGHISEASSHLL